MRDKIFQSKIKILLFLLYIHLKFNFHSFLSVEKCNLAKDSAAFEKKKKKGHAIYFCTKDALYTKICVFVQKYVCSK